MATRVLAATVLSAGRTSGVAVHADRGGRPPILARTEHAGTQVELDAFRQCLSRSVSELGSLVGELERRQLQDQADIARIHLMMLEDASFRDSVRRKIEEQGLRAERAIEEVVLGLITLFEESGSEMQAARRADLKDLELRLKRAISGRGTYGQLEPSSVGVDRVAIVEELLPSHVFDAREHRVRGFITANGTGLAHSVILARLCDLPVLRVDTIDSISPGEQLVLDGDHGRVLVDPDEHELARRPARGRTSEGAVGASPIKLWLSVIDPLQLDTPALSRAVGVGLYRTEFLFMRQEGFPSEDVQLLAYRKLFERSKGKPVTVRTLDIGGDKLLPYFTLGPQRNPYLGLRAHRVYRFHPELLVTQARAILRAAGPTGNLRLLYPMIESLDSLTMVQALVREAVESLRKEGASFPETFEEGLLIEVPSTLWDYEALMARVDFVSLGTNDLLQYFFAADRTAPNIVGYYVPEHPTALRMLRWLVERSARANKPLSVCGEIAGDSAFLPLLAGVGIRHLTVAPGLLPRIQTAAASLDLDACASLAEAAIAAPGAAEVRRLLDEFGGEHNPRPTSRAQAEDGILDPICGMLVEVDGSTLSVRDGERRAYFCSPECLKRYRAAAH